MEIRIIRTDGSEEVFTIESEPFREIATLINAKFLSAVNLQDGRVMLVDGNGLIELKPVSARKPVNPKATALFHAICIPSTTHQIVGDVAIANDEDFA